MGGFINGNQTGVSPCAVSRSPQSGFFGEEAQGPAAEANGRSRLLAKELLFLWSWDLTCWAVQKSSVPRTFILLLYIVDCIFWVQKIIPQRNNLTKLFVSCIQ